MGEIGKLFVSLSLSRTIVLKIDLCLPMYRDDLIEVMFVSFPFTSVLEIATIVYSLAKGVYADLCPSNIIFTNDNKISLIDLESFSSFKLIFEKSKEDYEKFSLDATWKPAETARRDFNEFYKSYIEQCLGIQLDYNLDSIENIEKTLRIIQ